MHSSTIARKYPRIGRHYSQSNETVHCQKFENYSVLTLNKPKVNSIDSTMLNAIQQKLKEVESDPAMRGIIFTGIE
jgi:enoyl-CoA hydratase/carnithine racemase